VLIVFDLDGTLIDSRRDLADATNALIVERGGSPLPVDRVAAMVGEGAATLVRRALSAAGIADSDPASALQRFLELYDDRLLATTKLYDGIEEALDELSRRALLAVLTNKPVGAAQRILEGLGVARAFYRVVGGDGPHPRKPDPQGLFQLITDARATPALTTMVGDSRVDIATAHAAGCGMCIAAYGFGYRTDVELRGTELIAHTPRQLASVIPALD
jgi:phosphoglycolate phosphatase